MLLQKNMTLNGVTIAPCYIVVGAISISADRNKMSFIAEYKSGIEADAFQTDCFTCDYLLNGDNPEAQAYAYMKSLSAFSDAELS
ncbi:hypothetical protein [Klebsiella michiganensis]|uniref:hypothetical protein n=1 Tax=Klebsiella michiganensis TaxID=1134687 RepID=UPI00190A00A5|nr:hypothetical protein [Klebsiella michiganensis]QQO65737.1 hypothetical protein IE970_22075 [Klebsiella michiganensis]